MCHDDVPALEAREVSASVLCLASYMFLNQLPISLVPELLEIKERANITLLDALVYSLDYELGGCACTAAALPDEDQYRMFRLLEWNMPFDVSAKFAEVSEGVHVRQVSGYIGVLSGHSERHGFSIAMNQAPEDELEEFNAFGHPASWLLREALASEKPEELLMNSVPVVRAASVLITYEDRAVELMMRPSGNHEVVRRAVFPEVLVMTNFWDVDDDTETMMDWWWDLEDEVPAYAELHVNEIPEEILQEDFVDKDVVVY
jgi:hypothetical protein